MDPRSPKKSALEGLTRPYKAYKAQIAQDIIYIYIYNTYYMSKGLKRLLIRPSLQEVTITPRPAVKITPRPAVKITPRPAVKITPRPAVEITKDLLKAFEKPFKGNHP